MQTRTAALIILSGLAAMPALARQSHAPSHAEPKTAPSHAEPKAAPSHAEPKTAPRLAAPVKIDTKPGTRPAAETRPEIRNDPHAAEAAKAEPEPARAATAPDDEGRATPDQALTRLQEGNQRWASGKTTNPRTDAARLKSQADGGQTPFAAILTCADSRIPVERIFDQGVGDIFDVRIAGNIAGDHETGSLEYSAEHLKTPVLVVMGHTKCGAVSAAATDAKVGGSIPSLLAAINPSVARARAQNPTLKGADLVPVAIKENVWQSVFTIIRTSPICRERIAHGELKIVGAVYNIADGSIEWMGEHPWQSELLAAFGNPGEKATEQAAQSEAAH